jgi:hypothetical protein
MVDERLARFDGKELEGDVPDGRIFLRLKEEKQGASQVRSCVGWSEEKGRDGAHSRVTGAEEAVLSKLEAFFSLVYGDDRESDLSGKHANH